MSQALNPDGKSLKKGSASTRENGGTHMASGSLGTTSARLVAVKLKSANKNIFRALLSLSSANLLVRLMGLLNTIIITARFGQGPQMDAYFVASTLPMLLAQLLSSSLEGSVIPVYARLRTKGGREEASRLFSTLLNLIILGVILLTIVMFVFREQLLYISAPGTTAAVLAQTVALAPFVFPILGFMILNSYMEFLMNAEGTFGWPAYAGLLVPLTTAFFVITFGGYGGVFAIGVGTLVGQGIQLCAVVFRAYKAKLRYRLVFDLRMAEIKAVGRAAWPSLLGGVIGLASPLVDQVFASYQDGGTISAINNALKINSVVTGVIFAAAGRAALPYLAAQAGMGDMKAFKNTLRLYTWGVALVTLFISLFIIFFANIIIIILFHRGAFSYADVNRTSITLVGFALGLMPMAIGFILSRAFTALSKNRFLMYVTITSVFLNAIFDDIFGGLWHSFGIAFATSIYYVCSMLMLTIALRRSIGRLDLLKPPPELAAAVWRVGIEPYYLKWRAWQKKNVEERDIIPHDFYQVVSRWFLIIVVFAAGVYGSIMNALFTVRVAFGSIVVLFLLRYPYLLLLAWAGFNVLIGSPLPIFNGNNLLSGMTLPTFLLIFYLPTPVALKRMPSLLVLLTIIMWILFSFWYSPLSTSQFFTTWSIFFDFFSVCILVILIVDSKARLIRFIDMIHVPAIFVALYGIWGYVTRTIGILDTSTGSFRATSIFTTTPPGLALYLSIILPLTIYRISTLRGYKRLGGILVLLILLITIALTLSRGALIIIPLTSVIIIPFLPTRKAKAIMLSSYLAAAGFVLAAATALNITILDRFLNSDLGSLNGRTYLWAAVLEHFDPTQLQGYGQGASDALLGNLQVGSGGIGVIGTVSHNLYLEMMYDHGLIGLLLLLSIFLVQGIALWRRWLTTKSTPYRLFLALTLWALISIACQCAETNDLWAQQTGIYFFIVMALPFAKCWDNKKEFPEEEMVRPTIPHTQWSY